MVTVKYEYLVEQPNLVIQLDENMNGLPDKIIVKSGLDGNNNRWIYKIDRLEITSPDKGL